MKLDTFEIDESDDLPAKVHNISPLTFSHAFVNFTKKVPSTECYYGFEHFWQAYKLTKIWMCLHVSQVIPPNEHI